MFVKTISPCVGHFGRKSRHRHVSVLAAQGAPTLAFSAWFRGTLPRHYGCKRVLGFQCFSLSSSLSSPFPFFSLPFLPRPPPLSPPLQYPTAPIGYFPRQMRPSFMWLLATEVHRLRCATLYLARVSTIAERAAAQVCVELPHEGNTPSKHVNGRYTRTNVQRQGRTQQNIQTEQDLSEMRARGRRA